MTPPLLLSLISLIGADHRLNRLMDVRADWDLTTQYLRGIRPAETISLIPSTPSNSNIARVSEG
jgi:hypothetical protein